jgi:hypothetical protein
MYSENRDDWIRTSGPFVPNEVRYQAALHPATKMAYHTHHNMTCDELQTREQAGEGGMGKQGKISLPHHASPTPNSQLQPAIIQEYVKP